MSNLLQRAQTTTRAGRETKKPKKFRDSLPAEVCNDGTDTSMCDGDSGCASEVSSDEKEGDEDLPVPPPIGTTSSKSTPTPKKGTGKNSRAWGPVNVAIPPTKVPTLLACGRRRALNLPTRDAGIKHCIKTFWVPEMDELVVDKTNAYAKANESKYVWAKALVAKPLTVEEFRQYLGARLAIGLVRSSEYSDLWRDDFPYSRRELKLMGKSRFETITSALHCQDDDPDAHKGALSKPSLETLYTHLNVSKIGKLLQLFQDACLSRLEYRLPVQLSLDEMMIRFQGSSYRVFKRQAKPTSMGMKMVALTDYHGFLIGFILESGPSRGWPVAEMVKQLCSKLKPGHVVYMDNLYCNVSTLEALAKMNVFACGTVRKSGGVPVATNLDEKVTTQGQYNFCMRAMETGQAMTGVTWMDSGPAKFLSTAHGAEPDTVERHVRGQKERQVISCLRLCREYNLYMHGNDLADQMRKSFTIQMRSKKWWKPIFNWIFDSAMINAFLLYLQMFDKDADRKEFLEDVCRILCEDPTLGGGVENGAGGITATVVPSTGGPRLVGLGGGTRGDHRLATSAFLIAQGTPIGKSGKCFVCDALNRNKVNLKSEMYCIGCKRFFHQSCHILFHEKTKLCLVENKVVGE